MEAVMKKGIFFSALLGALWAMPVLAQEIPSSQPVKATGGNKEKTITLGPIRVTGQVRKPEAFYILQRATLSYPEVEQKRSFIGKSVESVDKGTKF
jgi:hypothetical protein